MSDAESKTNCDFYDDGLRDGIISVLRLLRKNKEADIEMKVEIGSLSRGLEELTADSQKTNEQQNH